MTHAEITEQSEANEVRDILTYGLPDLCNKKGVLSPAKLSETLRISRQAIHKWWHPNRPNKIPARQIQPLVDLSARQKNKDELTYKPLTIESLLPFVSNWGHESS